MTDKELRKLKRDELLEILFFLQKEIDNLKQQNQQLEKRLENFILNRQSISDEDFKRIEEIVKNAIDSKEKISSENNSEVRNGEVE